MRRRAFITLLGGAAAWPVAAHAQADRVRSLGVLMATAERDAESQLRLGALHDGLQKRGWTEGHNLRTTYRWSDGNVERNRIHAAELVALNPDVLFAAPASAIVALRLETRTIPIVFAQTPDPVGLGFVESLSRPGGNITGFALYEYEMALKWLELLKQIAPKTSRVAMPYDPEQPTSFGYITRIEAAAGRFGVQAVRCPVKDADGIQRAIEGFAAVPNGSLVVPPGALIVKHRDLIISLAARHRLPNIFAFRYYVANGGLASYGVDNIDMYRRAASYVDRILKGEKAGDLPIQFADKFELVINLKTAKALGLEIPVSLLARTDEVIE